MSGAPTPWSGYTCGESGLPIWALNVQDYLFFNYMMDNIDFLIFKFVGYNVVKEVNFRFEL